MPLKYDRWPELCELVAEDDGLVSREAGPWAEDKLFYWNRYLEITTSAMVGNPNWSSIVYVDLFGGPGILHLRETKKRIPGSALIAAKTSKPFDKILVCEKSPEIAQACEQRLFDHGAKNRSIVFLGDCNSKIGEITSHIPKRSLTVAFIDPEGLHVDFDTIVKLTSGRRVDLLILLADRMDIFRNIKNVYLNKKSSKLDTFMGRGCDWRNAYNNLENQDAGSVCELFENLLKDQLKKLGYKAFSRKVMRSAKSPIYRVIYASKSDKGLEFWNKISAGMDAQGQMPLFPT